MKLHNGKTKCLLTILIFALMLLALLLPVFAEEPVLVTPEATEVTEQTTAQDDTVKFKAIAAAALVAVAAAAAAIGMSVAICKSVEGISRQPEAGGKISSGMMLGLVFLETVVIYALIVAILIIFVL